MPASEPPHGPKREAIAVTGLNLPRRSADYSIERCLHGRMPEARQSPPAKSLQFNTTRARMILGSSFIGANK